jgi:hypothetical protein
MLDRDDVSLFIEREKEQGWHLRGALLDRYQKTFSEPKPEIRRLRAKKGSLLNASNAYARVRWMRALGAISVSISGLKLRTGCPINPSTFSPSSTRSRFTI